MISLLVHIAHDKHYKLNYVLCEVRDVSSDAAEQSTKEYSGRGITLYMVKDFFNQSIHSCQLPALK